MSMHAVGNPKPRSTAVGFILIFAAAALAVAPQLIRGDSCGHDFDFHLVSWFDALNAWRHGIPYPHWTASANFGAGEPRFVFYSPLTWMLGAALGAIIPWQLVPVALTFLIFAGTGLTTRALARQVMNEGAASLAGCIAIFSGYPLFTAYERSAFAELAGGMWIPLVLLYGLRSGATSATSSLSRHVLSTSTVPLAISIAGAWLSNPPVGVMASYTLAALTIVEAIQARSVWPALRNAIGGTLGIGLSAIYLVPAAWEQRWVDIHGMMKNPGQLIENNWLFAHHADPEFALHDQVLHTVSLIAVGMVALTVLGLIACKLRDCFPGPPHWFLPLALILPAVLLLQFSISRPLWNMLPDLRFLQFPWRWLLVIEAPMALFLAAAVWPRTTAKPVRIYIAGLCAAYFFSMIIAGNKFLFQPCYPEDTVASVATALNSGQGTIGTDEYAPPDSDISVIPLNLPEACLASDSQLPLGKTDANGNLTWDASQGSCEATYSGTSSAPEHIRIAGVAPKAGYLVIRLLTYPAWKVTLNGAVVTPNPARQDGLTTLPLQRGAFNIAIDWTATRDVILGRWLSALSVLALTAIWLFERKFTQSRLS